MQFNLRCKQSLFLTAALSFLAAAPAAQVTGVPGANDYTITGWGGGGISGSKSSDAANSLVGASTETITFTVSAAPLTPVFILISPVPRCPNYWPMGPSCTGPVSVHQSIDLDLSSPIFVVAGQTSIGGKFAIPATVPACVGFILSTQAVLVDATCTNSFGLRFTQAYDLNC